MVQRANSFLHFLILSRPSCHQHKSRIVCTHCMSRERASFVRKSFFSIPPLYLMVVWSLLLLYVPISSMMKVTMGCFVDNLSSKYQILQLYGQAEMNTSLGASKSALSYPNWECPWSQFSLCCKGLIEQWRNWSSLWNGGWDDVFDQWWYAKKKKKMLMLMMMMMIVHGGEFSQPHGLTVTIALFGGAEIDFHGWVFLPYFATHAEPCASDLWWESLRNLETSLCSSVFDSEYVQWINVPLAILRSYTSRL